MHIPALFGGEAGWAAPGREGNPVLTPGVGPGSKLGFLQGTPHPGAFLSWQSENIPDGLCYKDSDCPPGEPVVAGNGEAWSGQGWGQKGAWSLEAPGIVPVPPFQE